jgi:hypothetical protein
MEMDQVQQIQQQRLTKAGKVESDKKEERKEQRIPDPGGRGVAADGNRNTGAGTAFSALLSPLLW